MKTASGPADHYTWGNNCEGFHILRDEALSVIKESMPPGASEVWHYHNKAQQVFYLLSGKAFFETGKDNAFLSTGESLRVLPGILHRISNPSDEIVEFLVVSAPMAQGDRVEIIDYAPEYRSDVKKLNYEWLEKYFRVEPGDEKSLSDPEAEIIAKGGLIYFVRVNNKIVGTASLLQKQPGIFELGKMAVTEAAKGQGIGKKLIEFCILMAKQRAAVMLILYSNTRLANAIHLYRQYGFEETELETGLYERADIKMTRRI